MTRTCSDCGKGLSRGNRTGKCNDCLHGTARRARVLEMRTSGSSLAQIGAELGMTKQAVRGMLERIRGGPESAREVSVTSQQRAAVRGSALLLNAYRRYFGELDYEPPCRPSQSGRPRSVVDTITYLDALSRTRALTLDESLTLQRAIREHDRARKPSMTLGGVTPEAL